MNFGTHHAYVIEGDKEKVLLSLKEYLNKFYDSSSTNPDIFEHHFPNFLVEHARLIKDADIKTPFSHAQKSILISFDSITREAQNALLKVLEDPSPTSRFFIVTNSVEVLLPTVLSRVEVVRHESYGINKSVIDISSFLKAKPVKRLEMVSALLKQIGDEELSKQEARNFLKNLKIGCEEELLKGRVDAQKLKTILKTIVFSEDKSASLKLLLERVSLC